MEADLVVTKMFKYYFVVFMGIVIKHVLTQITFERDTSFNNWFCGNQATLVGAARSRRTCAASCDQLSSCPAFFFDDTTNECFHHSIIPQSTDGCVSRSGHFYKKPGINFSAFGSLVFCIYVKIFKIF